MGNGLLSWTLGPMPVVWRCGEEGLSQPSFLWLGGLRVPAAPFVSSV